MYQTAVGRHGDPTCTANSGAVRNLARYHCAVGPAVVMISYKASLALYLGLVVAAELLDLKENGSKQIFLFMHTTLY